MLGGDIYSPFSVGVCVLWGGRRVLPSVLRLSYCTSSSSSSSTSAAAAAAAVATARKPVFGFW